MDQDKKEKCVFVNVFYNKNDLFVNVTRLTLKQHTKRQTDISRPLAMIEDEIILMNNFLSFKVDHLTLHTKKIKDILNVKNFCLRKRIKLYPEIRED